ncbi:hypothetical protein KSB_44240 [Ktedonobacter robiniae]|uniref:Uncharacterized protein n=1 Tax=Ktedonobacter robiniae TaxID=2778365 RepID=A0ABQ3USZ8_9CHLR|nr:hypothetical protein KSB_44240 [Ktedonobacter robiniae]
MTTENDSVTLGFDLIFPGLLPFDESYTPKEEERREHQLDNQ